MSYYLKKYWKANALAVATLLVVCALQIGNNLLLMQLFQRIIELDLRGFFFWMLVMAGAWFVLLWTNGLSEFLQGRAIRAMNNEVRRDMTATLLQKTHVEFHEADTGEYLSRFTNDVNQIEKLAWQPFYECVSCAASAVFSVAALLTLHWSLLVASLVNVAVMMLVPRLFGKRMEKLGEDCETGQSKATSRLKDILSGYDVLRAFGREQRFREGAEEASEQIERPKLKLACVKGFVGAGFGCVNVVMQLLIDVLIGVLSIRGVILQSALMGGGNLCGSLSNGIGTVAQLLLSFSSTKPYFEKITVRGGSLPLENGSSPEIADSIAVSNLTFGYGERAVLNNLSLSFKKGGKYALTGPSGCGKSTLLKLLLGWLPGYGGSISFDGADARGLTPEQIGK